MSQQHLNVGVIGLGVMGQRMLARLAGHPRLRPVLVWDANPAAVAQTLQSYPQLRAAACAADLITEAGLRSLYIATPPAPHMTLSEQAFDAGLTVFCEKPLTVDFDAARRCIARIAAEGQRAAVNFALASSPGLTLLQQHFGAGNASELGALQAVELELAFAAWPRPWQAAAGAWLAERTEGGFCREVLSHFIFALQRVLGPASVVRSRVDYPSDGRMAETDLQAELKVGAVNVLIKGKVGGEQADLNHMQWRGAAGSVDLREWFSRIEVHRHDGRLLAGISAEADGLRQRSQVDQLDQWVAMIEGRQHGLPGYAEALAVQETIESLLQTRSISC
ncbi:Gfo/Idh/MocA family protein [Roseateles oligotrophus]|uniref:Gfo/Idh/MocA family oxidoreductase n=1 Tax=Roseateles oligotrophus TaxID=1769250 RepID=A0ABT2Y867_9BURK|nr:Gfo/Idh/MocA family oxidoreductase [Roseateles oligotrophus]MCV2366492.1 Gfo/Idh/MocA family oxidoreductase [Roseateles oligotrophus]